MHLLGPPLYARTPYWAPILARASVTAATRCGAGGGCAAGATPRSAAADYIVGPAGTHGRLGRAWRSAVTHGRRVGPRHATPHRAITHAQPRGRPSRAGKRRAAMAHDVIHGGSAGPGCRAWPVCARPAPREGPRLCRRLCVCHNTHVGRADALRNARVRDDATACVRRQEQARGIGVTSRTSAPCLRRSWEARNRLTATAREAAPREIHDLDPCPLRTDAFRTHHLRCRPIDPSGRLRSTAGWPLACWGSVVGLAA